MSTVRTAILKLAAIGAGAALAGGGAVHVAEQASKAKPQYVKHAKKQVKPVPPRPRHKETVVAQAPCCAPVRQTEAVPLPPPPVPLAAEAAPPPPEQTEVRTRVVHEDLYDHGFNHGGFFNGFFGGGSTGGVYYTSSGGHHHHGSSGGSSGGTPVPAPPMLVLFGAAAAAIVRRRHVARKPA